MVSKNCNILHNKVSCDNLACGACVELHFQSLDFPSNSTHNISVNQHKTFIFTNSFKSTNRAPSSSMLEANASSYHAIMLGWKFILEEWTREVVNNGLPLLTIIWNAFNARSHNRTAIISITGICLQKTNWLARNWIDGSQSNIYTV